MKKNSAQDTLAPAADEVGQITQLLSRYSAGDESALEALLPLVYRQLHEIARRFMHKERQGHTLQATALVNEAYMSLSQQKAISWESRSHFLAVSALAMRQVLAAYARRKKTLKRGQGVEALSFDDALYSRDNHAIDFAALDTALTKLEQEDGRQAKIVELRYFGGLSIEETATVLGVSERTVKREWMVARAWLFRQLSS